MNQSFESLASATIFSQTLPGEAGLERIPVAFVSGNFFQTYRMHALMGRLFAESEDKKGAAPVAVLARGFWMTRYGSDPGILGKTITLERGIYTIIGVLPDFPYHDPADVYVPAAPRAEELGMVMREQHTSGTSVIGRLKTGTTMEQALAELKQIAARLEREYPGSNRGCSAMMVPCTNGSPGGRDTAC